jgi:predicted ATPase
LLTQGFAAPEVEQAFARADDLCRMLGSAQEVVPALLGIGTYYTVRAELGTALELAGRVLKAAESSTDSAHRIAACAGMGVILYWSGAFAQSREYLDRGAALYDPVAHGAAAVQYGQDWGVVCLSHSALAHWMLGFPQVALERSEAALRLAGQVGHPYSSVYAIAWAAQLRKLRRDWADVTAQSERCVALAGEQGFPLFQALGIALQGCALVGKHQTSDGIEQIRRAVEVYRSTGAELSLPQYVADLAIGCAEAGSPRDGIRLLDETLARTEQTGERFYTAELLRLRGELLSQAGGDSDEVLDWLREAVGQARSQDAAMLELRAATSLSRALSKRGLTDEASQVLTRAYQSVPERSSTLDFREADAQAHAVGLVLG